MFGKKGKKNIHMDYASTTPVSKKALKKMEQFLSFDFFNPSSVYMDGQKVKIKIEEYRSKISKKLQIRSNEIYFVNGGTESINIAILGVLRKYKKGHIISTKVEHPAVLQTLEYAQKEGFHVTLLDVDQEGLISVEDFKKSLREDTVLVTIVYATSETGTIQPISKISREILKYKQKVGRKKEDLPYFHTDASQAGLTLDLNINGLKVDMMTLDGSKIYGPKATGCLIKKSYVEIDPVFFGGGQEKNLRPGTQNVSGIVGFSEALLETFERKEKDNKKFKKLQKYMIEKIKEDFPEVEINGSLKFRLLNNINICVPDLDSEFAVIMLDEMGINCSFMTACKSVGSTNKSEAIKALGKENCASSSLRFSFGRETTKTDIDKTIKSLRYTIDFQSPSKDGL